MEVCVRRTVRIDALGADNYVLRLEGEFGDARPGQFVMLALRDRWPVQLPRPFSYFDLVPGEWASFFVKAIGPGTRALVEAGVGAEVRVTGPLGGSFADPPPGAPEPICIAGGVGLAPFLLWCKRRGEQGAGPVPLLYGGANASAIVGHDHFPGDAQIFHISTDDGSLGFRGNVLQLYQHLVAQGELNGAAPVYCCGPDPMMHAIAKHCAERGVACHVSLETYMACGYGVCNGCSVEVSEGARAGGRLAGKHYVKTCIAGPVFSASEIEW